MSNLFYLPRVHSSPGSKLWFYQTNTSTPQDVYQDAELQNAHTQPVVADADGYFDPIYLDPAASDYRILHTDANDVQIEQIDDIPANQSAGRSLRLSDETAEIIFENPLASANAKKWRLGVASGTLILQTLNDAEDTLGTVFYIERSSTSVTAIRHYCLYQDRVMVNDIPVTPIMAVKTASESLTSNTTLGNDSDLIVEVKVGGQYEIDALIRFEGGGGGFKRAFAFTGTTGANGIRTCGTAHVNGSGSTLAMADGTSAVSYATITATGGQGDYERISGVFHASTAGLFKLQWAQVSSNGTATTVLKSSYLKLRKLSSATS